MKTGVIKAKDIRTNNQRFDCSYHLSEAQNVRRVLTEMPYKILKIEDVTFNIFNGGRYNRVYITNPSKGIKFLTGSNIQSADLENVKIVSKKYMPGTDEMLLDKDWVLITRSGTIGKCAYSNNNFKGKFGSEDIIRLIPNNQIKAGLVYAYLASKYGYALLTQGTFGAVIQHIEPNFIKTLPIPEFPLEFQEKIDGMIKESARLREEASDALKKAQNRATGFISFVKPSENKGINIRSIASSHNKRMEASYYVSDNRNIYDIIIERPYKLLGEITEKIFRPGIFKRKYVENGITFLGGADILLSIPNSDKKLSEKQVNQMPVLRVKKDWLLLTCGGTIGKVVYIDEQLSKCVISQHVMRIVPKDNAEVLFAFLSSSVGENLINMFTYGSVIPSVENHHLELLPIPIYSEEETKEIKSQVREYVSKTEKAKTLELEAISLVESEIEKWTKE